MKATLTKSLFYLLIFHCILFSDTFAQNTWANYELDIAGCKISFPSDPDFNNQPFSGWSANNKDGQVTYLIAFIDEPNESFTIADIERFLLPSMFSNDQQISKSYLLYEGFDAIDFLYHSNSRPVLTKKGRVIIRDHKIYVLQVLYYHDDLQNFAKFANSLSFD